MSITWNGVSSDTIGVVVERIPNRYVPTRRFSPQQVAGRNGNILLVDKSFPNVEQEYEVYLSAEAQGLPSVARACAEWLMGPDGYCRLEDSYDTTVYREAFLMGGYDLENILNKFGRCTITFSCKPQKYLITGDTPISIPAGPTTYTGDVVQFDGVTGASITSLPTTISPSQDLHGYDKPWSGGNGKNKVDYLSCVGVGTRDDTDSIHASVSVSSDVVTLTGDASYNSGGQIFKGIGSPSITGTFTVSADVKCTTGRVAFGVGAYEGGGTSDVDTNYDVTANTWTHISRTFTDKTYAKVGIFLQPKTDTNVLEVKNLQLELGSTATSYEPYSNICPISGRTGLSVYRTGKNLFNKNATDLYAGHALSPSTGNTYSAGSYTVTGFIKCKAGEKYITSGTGGSNDVCFYDANKRRLSGSSNFNNASTAPSGAEWLRFDYKTSSADTVQLEQAATATAYEAFGNTYAVDWTTQAGTVYGGTLDVVTGLLTVDMAYIASYNGETINEPWVSSMDAYAAGTTPTIGAQVVYTLATPLTYQLTPQEVEVLVGENNVWSSSGPVSVTVVAPFGGIVTNPTPFEARPMLTVSGIGEITINGKTIQILESVSDFDIDCEAMEAEDNSKIYCMDFPELSGGENEIVGDGSITALTVTPRWWTL